MRYSEFVEAAREVFAYKLKDKESKLMLKSTSMDDISRSRVELNKSLNTLNGKTYKCAIIFLVMI